MAGHSRCSNDIYAFRLSLKWIAGLKACWTAHCIAPHHCSGLIRKNSFENSIADSKISEFTHSEVGDRRLACSQAAFSDACIIDKRWCTVLSMLVLILINTVHTRLL